MQGLPEVSTLPPLFPGASGGISAPFCEEAWLQRAPPPSQSAAFTAIGPVAEQCRERGLAWDPRDLCAATSALRLCCMAKGK